MIVCGSWPYTALWAWVAAVLGSPDSYWIEFATRPEFWAAGLPAGCLGVPRIKEAKEEAGPYTVCVES